MSSQKNKDDVNPEVLKSFMDMFSPEDFADFQKRMRQSEPAKPVQPIPPKKEATSVNKATKTPDVIHLTARPLKETTIPPKVIHLSDHSASGNK